ncbi:Fibroblast growth factor receptor 1 [Paramuricea clavata]|uniref:Fibroblast growth factor receptor 1 n=1 Tax=Paramuricea clavata TaxID=317549 RepID=A0A7D9HPY3_PARCT|nr:Fibroblast growth factor receptor 1 [Paramuricea clavata]
MLKLLFTACLPGQSYNLTSQKCGTCPKNTYQPQQGELECITCPNQTITKISGSTRREDCVQSCPEGSFYSFTRNDCELCPKNFFQTQKGQFNCAPCPTARVTVSNGSKLQEDCLKSCSRGSFFNRTKQGCQECPLNTYEPNFGAFECISCPDGGITLNTSSTTLEDCSRNCSAGSFHNFTTKKCENCPLHSYQPKAGQTSCIACQDGRITMKVSTVREEDCIIACSAGNYYNLTMETCKVCPLNSYQNLEAATSCLSCPANRITRKTGAASLTECISVSDAEESPGEDLTVIVAIPVVLTVLVVSACLLLICFYRRWRKENDRRMSAGPLDPRRRAFTDSDPEMAQRPKLNSVASMPNHHYKMKGAGLRPDDLRPSIRIANIPKELEIPRENLKFLGQVLGKGNFGKVEKAILLKDDRTENVVAVKMIKGGGTFSDEKELFDELEMLASLYPHPHPNIVNLVGGCTTSNGPLFVVVEYCGEGNLLKYLQKNQIQAKPKQEYVNIFPKAEKPGIKYEWKLQKALEICHGMTHLAKFKIIHRDVAARNVLLDENWVAKISDFGMARDIYVKQIYRKDTEGFLPVRWMAIESLESFIYNTQSDIWSFGILLWEIMSDGRVPYNNILDHTQLLNYIKSGRIMKRPKNCPKDLYHIMEKCWAKNPPDRPAFESLKDALEVLYENEVHKEDALPQRILRKFSSRRKKRRNEEDIENPGGKTRAKKTLSNSSGKKIAKIDEEEPNGEKVGKAEEKETKMEVLDPANETLNNEFENQGYQKSAGSSTSKEHDGSEKSPMKLEPKASNDNTFELDTISEMPVSRQNEEIQDSSIDYEEIQESSHDNEEDQKERTLSDSAEVFTTSLQHEIENELKPPTESVQNDGSSSIPDELTDASERPRMFSTDC